MNSFQEYLRLKLNGEKYFRTSTGSVAPTESVVNQRERTLFDFLRPSRIAATLSIATSMGFAGSLIYHWGFFSTFDRSALLLLTPGDYTTLALLLIVSIFFSFAIIASFFGALIYFEFMVLNWIGQKVSTAHERLISTNGFFDVLLSIAWRGVAVAIGIMFAFRMLTNFLASHTISYVPLWWLAYGIVFLFFSVLMLFGANPKARGLNLQIIGALLVVSVVVPLTAFGGAISSYSGYASVIRTERENECIDYGESLNLRKECLVRPLERGVLFRETGDDATFGTEDDRIAFKRYDGSLAVEFDAPYSSNLHWADVAFLKNLYEIPIIKNETHRAHQTRYGE